MDQKPTIMYKYAANHVVPVVHGVLVGATADPGPNQVTVHLYSEYPDVPKPFVVEEESEDTRVRANTIIREVQATLLLSLDTAHVMRQAFTDALLTITEDAEQIEGTEDDS